MLPRIVLLLQFVSIFYGKFISNVKKNTDNNLPTDSCWPHPWCTSISHDIVWFFLCVFSFEVSSSTILKLWFLFSFPIQFNKRTEYAQCHKSYEERGFPGNLVNQRSPALTTSRCQSVASVKHSLEMGRTTHSCSNQKHGIAITV